MALLGGWQPHVGLVPLARIFLRRRGQSGSQAKKPVNLAQLPQTVDRAVPLYYFACQSAGHCRVFRQEEMFVSELSQG